MASRPRRGPPQRRRPPPREFPEADELGSRELEIENKKFIIELKSNQQGRFVKILEMQTQGRGRIIFSIEKAQEFRSILESILTDYQQLSPADDITESERLRTESFNQGRRRYFVDLRQNSRGRFLKLTMLAGGKTFIAVPGEGLEQFHDAIAGLLDEHGAASLPPSSSGDGGREGGRGGGRERPHQMTPPPSEPMPDSREVRAGPKKFFFDVSRNERGFFIRLSEVQRSGRRMHLNIPHSCWTKMAEVFQAYSGEVPGSEDESSGSVSDVN